MVEKRQSTRTEQQYEFVLSHTDIVDLMKDAVVGLNPAVDEQFQIFVRKANGSEISLSLRPLYSTDKLVLRYCRATDAELDESFTDVDVS